MIGQVAPLSSGAGYPEDAIQNKPVIAWWATPFGARLDKERFEERPFVIAHQVSDQDALLNLAS